MRRAARTDSNQKEIVDALRDIGASVHPTHMVGQGFPDIVVGYQGENYLIEIKDGAKPPSKRKLTPDEERWHSEWLGTVSVANDINEAIEIVRSNLEKE